ncbi:MAG: hypothetical protein ABWY93_25795 [Mycobacterium sp.]
MATHAHSIRVGDGDGSKYKDLPKKFKAIVRYRDDSGSVSGLTFRLGATTTPSTPPGVDPNCVVINGDACFTGSGWGEASVSEVQQ